MSVRPNCLPFMFATQYRQRARASAFTLIELLVVVGLIGVLLAAVLVAGSAMVDSAKAKRTEFMLGVVRDSLEQFRDEQSESPSLARPAGYRARYGFYPPDEMEVFTSVGVPNGAGGSRAPGKAEFVPGPVGGAANPYPEMLFWNDGLTTDERAHEHRDLAAMIMALREYSEAASSMLEQHLPGNNWTTPLDDDGNPLQFLDRNGNGSFDPLEDDGVSYLVDDWGTPILYMSQRDFAGSEATASQNHPHWNEVSTSMIRLNGGQPILCSFGPNGQEQLSKEVVEAGKTPGPGAPPATLFQDWMDEGDARINSPLNEDNLYPDATLKEKLRRGSR